jgi:aryl sulfotransferase
MQQIVYEIVNRGQGNLSDEGHGHLYAICPWIDGVNSVGLEDSALVGEKPTRIIKTHLPTQLCPYSEEAKYIYVARHPVSCFASILDYNRTLLGPLMPASDKMVDWFCSDRMYWLPWPEHVAGWWHWAQSRDNVLFIHYEELMKNFGATLDQVAGFLGYRLTADEKQNISQKCSFEYMKDNEELFEMAPPNMFSVIGGHFMASGKKNRYDDVTPAIRLRILEYCRQILDRNNCPYPQFYPDVALRASESASAQ